MANFNKINIDGVPYDVEDTTARQSVAAEESAREQADTQLGQQIAAETSARQQADTQLGQQISEETTAREEADAGLQSQINNIAETYVNVKKYGAVGDGETIDSTAIATCLSENPGKRIYFPSGTYMINAPITLPDHTSLIGDGDSTIIKAAAGFSGTCMLQTRIWSPDSVVNDDYGYINLAHIAFDGSYKTDYTSTSGTGTGSWDGLHIGGPGPVLDHVSVYNMPYTGVSISDYRTSGYPLPRGEALFSNVTIKYNGNHGLYIMNGSHDGEYVNCVIGSNSRAVTNTYHNLVFSENNANGRFTNCHFYSDYGDVKPAFSVYIPLGAAPSRFTNCDIEGAANANIQCGADGTTLVNCYIYATFGASQVYIDAPCMFVGCLFGKQATDPVPSSKPAFNQIATFRNISTTPLNNVAFLNCRIMESDVPVVTYQPGANADNWIFDINGTSSVNPLNTASIPSSWKARWCGSFPTPIFEDSNV